MYFSPTLKILAAQSIVNNNITSEEIPKHLQEEMDSLQKEIMERDLHAEVRKKNYLQKILQQVDSEIEYFNYQSKSWAAWLMKSWSKHQKAMPIFYDKRSRGSRVRLGLLAVNVIEPK